MTGVLILLFLLGLGPLALLFGVDSRSKDPLDERGWWPGVAGPSYPSGRVSGVPGHAMPTPLNQVAPTRPVATARPRASALFSWLVR